MSNEKQQSKDDGGPAFPQSELDRTLYVHGGISIRDYFAAKAMAAILSNINIWEEAYTKSAFLTKADFISDQADTMADAMLEARKK